MINPATNPRIAIKTICKQLHDIFIQDESGDLEAILPKMHKVIEFYGLSFNEENEELEIMDAKLQWEVEINSVLCFKNFEYFRGVCEHFINFDKIWEANRNYLLNNHKNG